MAERCGTVRLSATQLPITYHLLRKYSDLSQLPCAAGFALVGSIQPAIVRADWGSIGDFDQSTVVATTDLRTSPSAASLQAGNPHRMLTEMLWSPALKTDPIVLDRSSQRAGRTGCRGEGNRGEAGQLQNLARGEALRQPVARQSAAVQLRIGRQHEQTKASSAGGDQGLPR
jgi:hypothetical protein